MKESRRRVELGRLPSLVFSQEELLLLRRSLVLLEQMLVARQGRGAQAAFALETIVCLQRKLEQMVGRVEYGAGAGVPLDANEVIILQTSVQIFALALQDFQEGERLQCMELSGKLAWVVD